MAIRARADACPGVFATHDAADGALARVRLPGGRLTAGQLHVLAGCAEDLGDGSLHLTSRGNVQLRGLNRDDGSLVRRLSDAGLLPAPSHERVRNFLASPLSGLAGGLLDVRPLVTALDAAVCARPELAGLPGRFLFAFDDGRGDVSAEDPDVCWHALSPSTGALLLASFDTGLRVEVQEAVSALVDMALRFLAVRGPAWRVRELPELSVLHPGMARTAPPRGEGAVGLGVFEWGVAGAPLLGELTARQARRIAEIAEWAVVTPWRSIVLPSDGDLGDLGDLHGTGLLTDPDAPGARVSACIGRPGCARSRADVRAEARRVLDALPVRDRVHFSGCERRCGKPRGPYVDVVAGPGQDTWASSTTTAGRETQ